MLSVKQTWPRCCFCCSWGTLATWLPCSELLFPSCSVKRQPGPRLQAAPAHYSSSTVLAPRFPTGPAVAMADSVHLSLTLVWGPKSTSSQASGIGVYRNRPPTYPFYPPHTHTQQKQHSHARNIQRQIGTYYTEPSPSSWEQARLCGLLELSHSIWLGRPKATHQSQPRWPARRPRHPSPPRCGPLSLGAVETHPGDGSVPGLCAFPGISTSTRPGTERSGHQSAPPTGSARAAQQRGKESVQVKPGDSFI